MSFDPIYILEYLERHEIRSWAEICAAIRGADYYTLLELIHLGIVERKQIGEHLYYGINKEKI